MAILAMPISVWANIKKQLNITKKLQKYISTGIGDQLGIARNNSNFGSAYLSLGKCQKAIKYYVKSLEIDTSTGNQSGIAHNNNSLGIVYFNLGDYKRAWSHLEDAIRLSDKMFFNFVRDRNKLFFITQYFYSHRL